MSKENVASEIRFLVDQFLSKHPKQTLNSLASRCGVNYTSFRKSYLGESTPSATNLLKIVSVLIDGNSTIEAFEKTPKHIKSSLRDSFPTLFDGQTEFIENDPNLMTVLRKNKSAFIIFCLALSHRGIEKSKVLLRMGSIVEDDINELIELELIYEENGLLKTHRDRQFFPLDVVKEQIGNLASFYMPNKKGNYLHMCTQSLSQNAHRKLFELHKKHHEEVRELLSDPDSYGDMPFFSVSFFDDFLRENDAGGNNNEG